MESVSVAMEMDFFVKLKSLIKMDDINHDWISHPEGKLQLSESIEKLSSEVPIEVGAEVLIVLKMVGSLAGRKLEDVIGQVGIRAIIQGVLSNDEFIATPKHKQFLRQFASLLLVNELGLEFELHRNHIYDIKGSPKWEAAYRSVYCTPKVAAGEKVGFFIDYTSLSNPLVYKKILFSVSEMEQPKKYEGEDRVILPASELVKFDPDVLPYLNSMADYGAIRDSDTTFKIFTKDEIKFLDPKIYMAVPELDFRKGAHEEILGSSDEDDNENGGECSFPF